MNEDSGEFSDELDVFEESIDEARQKALRNQTTYTNKPYDEAIDISQDLSMAESFDARDKTVNEREKKLKNDKYDEAVEISQSFDQMAVSAAAAKSKLMNNSDEKESKGGNGGMMKKGNDQSKSQSVLNKPFDEALEFSHSGSDESVDTRASQKQKKSNDKPTNLKAMPSTNSAGQPGHSSSHNSNTQLQVWGQFRLDVLQCSDDHP